MVQERQKRMQGLITQCKPPAKRAFTGLAGSPLATIAPGPTEQTKRGRPRKHASDADKQQDYRRRKELEAELARTKGQIEGQGRLHGETLYAPAKVEQIIGARERDEFIGGRKKKGRSLGVI